MTKNVIRFVHPEKKRKECWEQACVWLLRLDGGATKESIEELQVWLDSDKENQKAFMEMASLWDKSSILSELSEIFPLEMYAPKKVLSESRRSALTMFGASVLAAGSIFILNKKTGIVDSIVDNESGLYETSIGEQSKVLLSDGSEVLMNTNTQIELSFSDKSRDIILIRGEALFTVAEDVQRPFRVFAGFRVVEAVGTAFTVQRTASDGLEVMVTEGRVNYRQVNNTKEAGSEIATETFEALPESQLSIDAGEYIATQKEQITAPLKFQILPEEMEVKLAWRHGMLLFQGESLHYVLEEVGRYTTIEVEADRDIQDIKVEGYFRTGDIEGLLVSIQSNFNIDVQRISEKKIRLKSF